MPVTTRSQGASISKNCETMDCLRLDSMSTDQLREEAAKLRLPLSGDRNQLIDTIISFWERNPRMEANETTQTTAAPAVAPISEGFTEQTIPADTLNQVIVTLNNVMQQQQLLMQQMHEVTIQRGSVPVRMQTESNQRAGTLGCFSSNEQRRPLSAIPDMQTNTSPRSEGRTPFPVNAVTLLSTQIPEFGAMDDESVHVWVQRVEQVALIHGASDEVILLAVTNKLTKAARKWFDIQSDRALESRLLFKKELVAMFDRAIPFFSLMKQLEARTWNASREFFNQYAVDKMTLMYRLDLSEKNKINLLIGGVLNSSIRASALSLPPLPLDQFLDRMRQITEGILQLEKRTLPAGRSQQDAQKCRNCSRKGHDHKVCRDPRITCFYCKKPGHRIPECPIKN